MSVFTPDLMINNITYIKVDFLKKKGIKGLILDVDNTLTLHDSQEVLDVVLDWLDEMKKNGIKLTIVSNNYEKRIKPFAEKLGLEYVSFACKPFTVGFTKAVEQFKLKPEQMAVVGDQIYTDIIGGNLKGMYTILVTPFQLENTILFKMKRKLERLHIKKYHRLENKNKH